MNRQETLESAIEYVCSKREKEYGTPKDNFSVIANFWSIYLFRVIGAEVSLTPHDVAIMMTLLKLSRIASGVVKDDNYVDAAGYIACAAEIATEVCDGEVDELS